MSMSMSMLMLLECLSTPDLADDGVHVNVNVNVNVNVVGVSKHT